MAAPQEVRVTSAVRDDFHAIHQTESGKLRMVIDSKGPFFEGDPLTLPPNYVAGFDVAYLVVDPTLGFGIGKDVYRGHPMPVHFPNPFPDFQSYEGRPIPSCNGYVSGELMSVLFVRQLQAGNIQFIDRKNALPTVRRGLEQAQQILADSPGTYSEELAAIPALLNGPFALPTQA